ncbi:MAG: protoheme IX farnesyltransferase [Bacteroidales bacterium]
MKKAALFPDLIKYRLSLAVTFSAVTGYFVSGRYSTGSFFFLVTGIFILTCGAAALNQYTEKDIDARMERTKNRPVPAGRIRPETALAVSIILIISGSLLLGICGVIPFILGLLSVFIYNIVYTRLKRITLFSIIPGALVGALPPMIGFASSGAEMPGKEIILFSSFMFLWQVPHFWLILIRNREDYLRAGFRTFSSSFPEYVIRLLVFGWALMTTLSLIILSAAGVALTGIFNYILIGLNIFFILMFYSLLFSKEKTVSVKMAFMLINSFSLAIMILFILDAVLK